MFQNKFTPLKIVSSIVVCIATVSTVAFAADYNIRIAHVTSDKEPVHQSIERFADNVTKRTDGRVAFQIFPNALLGSNPEVYEQMRAGAPIMTVSDPGILGDFVADFGIFGGPYLIKEPQDMTKFFESDLYTTMTDRLRSETGIELLSLNWFFGSRHLIADKPIHNPDDIAGMTFRTPPNIMWVETFNAMGARPTQLAWSEVYSGLSAGVVEGAEAPLPSLYGAKLFEVKKVISMTGHFKGFTGLVINSDYFAALPEDIQTIMKEEATKTGEFMTDLMLKSENEWVAKLEAEGVTFNRDIDLAAFQEATASTYTKFPKWSDGLYQKVRTILDD